MITAYSKVHKQITSVEHSFLLKPPHEWVINPLIEDRAALDSTPTEFWVYDEATTILRVMSEEERDTDPDRVARVKDQKIAQLSSACELDIIRGFYSDALGTTHWYDSSAYDQLNLMSSLSITSPTTENPDGTSVFYACRDPHDADKEYQVHTYSQLKQVATDQAKNRISHLQRFVTLRQQVNAATRVSEINQIEWIES